MKISLSVVIAVLAMTYPGDTISIDKVSDDKLVIYIKKESGIVGSGTYNLKIGFIYACTKEWDRLFAALNNKFIFKMNRNR